MKTYNDYLLATNDGFAQQIAWQEFIDELEAHIDDGVMPFDDDTYVKDTTYLNTWDHVDMYGDIA
jgi:hypothetical protein